MASPTDYDVVYAFTGDLDKVSWSYWCASAALWHSKQRPNSPVAQRIKNPDVKNTPFAVSVYYGPRTSAGPKNSAALLLMHKKFLGRLRPEDTAAILGVSDPSPLQPYGTAKGENEITSLLNDLMADSLCPDNMFEPGPNPPEVEPYSLFKPPPELHPDKWESLGSGDQGKETSHEELKARVSSNLEELGKAKYPDWFVAYEILEKIGSPAVPTLIQAIESDNSRLRGRALDLLGKIGDKGAIDALQNAANVSQSDFKKLAKISGDCQVTDMGGIRVEVPVADLWEEYRKNAQQALENIQGESSGKADTSAESDSSLVSDNENKSSSDTEKSVAAAEEKPWWKFW